MAFIAARISVLRGRPTGLHRRDHWLQPRPLRVPKVARITLALSPVIRRCSSVHIVVRHHREPGRRRLDPWQGADQLGINEGMVAVADPYLWTIQQINRSSGRQLRKAYRAIRGTLPQGDKHRPAAGGQALGIARCREPRPTPPRPGPYGRRLQPSSTRLWLIHARHLPLAIPVGIGSVGEKRSFVSRTLIGRGVPIVLQKSAEDWQRP